jgi:8-oxo-dGTP diphosphatase
MPPPYCYEYPRPAVTVDVVVFTWDGERLLALFIRRKTAPFAGRWAIPGGFIDIDEPIEAAARRELREETGLTAAGPLEMVGVFGDPGRDPRGRTISLAHATAVRGPAPKVKGGDDAGEAAWLDAVRPPELAFDHAAVLEAARRWLVEGVDEGPVAILLLPREFGSDEIKALHRAIGRRARAAVTWAARMNRQGHIVPVTGADGRFRAAEGPPGTAPRRAGRASTSSHKSKAGKRQG